MIALFRWTRGVFVAGAAALVAFGCQAKQDDGTVSERLSAVDKAIADLRSEIQSSHEEIFEQIRGVKISQETMVRRGLVFAPQLAEKRVMPGDKTTIGIGKAPSIGPAKASVEVVEFADFECPFCIKNADLLRELVEQYPGQLRAGFRHYPLGRKHKQAVPAAKAAWAAQQQGKFWEMHDALFSSAGQLDAEVIRGHAEAIGLDMEKFDRDSESQAAAAAVFEDRAAGKKSGVRGTPAFYVNGRFAGNDVQSVQRMVQQTIGEQAGSPADPSS